MPIQKSPPTKSLDGREDYYSTQVRAHGKQYKTFDWPSIEVLINLTLTSDVFTNHMSSEMAVHKLSLSAFNVLTILSRKEGKDCCLHEISALLLVSRANVTGLIETLVKRGLVQRRTCPNDRRKCFVSITPNGEALLKEILPKHFQKTKQIVSVLSTNEKKTLARLLTRLRSSLLVVMLVCIAGPAFSEHPSDSTTLTIADAMAMAEKQGTQVLLAGERIREARGKALENSAGLTPQLSGNITSARQTVNLAAMGLTPAAFPGLKELKIGPFTTFDARISAVQNIFDLTAIGKIQSGTSQLRKAKLEEVLSHEQERLLAGVNCIQLLRAAASVRGSRADVTLAENLVRLISDQNRSGITTGLDKTRAEAQLSQAKTQLIQAQTVQKQAELDLKRTIGMDFGTSLRLDGSLDYVTKDVTNLNSAISLATQKRLELKIAAEELNKNAADYRAALGEQIPSIAANANYGRIGNQPNVNADQTYFAGVQLHIPLLDVGSIGRITESRSKRKQAEILLNDMHTQVEQDVRMAYQDLEQARAQYHNAKQFYDLSQREMSMVSDQFKSGVGDSVSLVTSENSLTRSRENYLSALAQYHASRMGLAYAIGEMKEFVP